MPLRLIIQEQTNLESSDIVT